MMSDILHIRIVFDCASCNFAEHIIMATDVGAMQWIMMHRKKKMLMKESVDVNTDG